MAGDRDLKVALKIELESAQAESSLKRLESAFDNALRRLGKSEAEIGLIKSLAREVEEGKRKLAELPEEQQRLIRTLQAQARGVRLLDELGIVKSHRQIREEIDALGERYRALKASGVLSLAELAQVKGRLNERMRELRESMNGGATASARLGAAFGGLGAILTGGAIAGGLRALAGLSDTLTQLEGRLRLVEGSQAGATARLSELAGVANRARVPVADVADAYAKMAGSIRSAGGSTEQAVQFNEALALALKTSGASAQEAGAVMRQLGQALQRGKLQGDEFVSVAENGGRVLDYLAASLGVSRGQLAAMAEAGELTTDKLLRLSGSLEQIRKDAGQMPLTVGDAVTQIRNAFTQWAASSTLVRGAVSALAQGLTLLAQNMDLVVGAVAALGAAFVAAKLPALGTAVAGLAATIAALNPVTLALAAAAGAVALAVAGLSGALGRGAGEAERLRGAIDQVKGSLEQLSGPVATTMKTLTEAVAKASGEATAAAERLLAGAKGSAEAEIAALSGRLAEIEKQAAAAQAVIDARYTNETARAQASAALVRVSEEQKLQAIEAGQLKALTAIETAYARVRERAGATALDLEKIEQETAQKRSAIWGALEAAYAGTIERLSGQNRKLEADIVRFEEARRAFNAQTEGAIREERLKGLTGLEQYAARVREIDEKLAQAREAAAAGDVKRAETLGREAIAQAKAINTAVTSTIDGVTVTVVSASEAQSRAIGKIRAAQEIVNDAFERGKTAAADQIEENERAIRPLEARLAEARREAEGLREALAQDLRAKIEIDSNALDEAARKVEAGLGAMKLGVEVEAKLEAAKRTLDAFRADPQNAILEMQVRAATEEAGAAIGRFREAAAREGVPIPAGLDIAPARQALERLVSELRATETASKHTVKTNADLARAEILGLNGTNTSSTHTITIRRVEANATGGLVGRALAAGQRLGAQVARFAQGGPVFPRQRGGWVPGTGDRDTVPRTLEAGAFVLRKAAAARYRSVIGGLIAPFAQGGRVLPPRARELPRKLRERALPEWLRRRGEGMAFGGVEATGTSLERLIDEIGRRKWNEKGGLLERLLELLYARDREQEDELRRAGVPVGNDGAAFGRRLLDGRLRAWREAASRGDQAGAESIAAMIIAMARERLGARFAAGGAIGGAAVPALLTPGEYVVPRRTVARLGLPLLEAMNALALPSRGLAEALLAGVARFAQGGPVGLPFMRPALPGLSSGIGAPVGAPSYTNSVSIQAPSAQSARELARILLPELEALMRRQRG